MLQLQHLCHHHLIQFSSVQLNSLTDWVPGGDMRDGSAENLFQSFLQEALISSSGMGRDVHSLMLSIQHFICQPWLWFDLIHFHSNKNLNKSPFFFFSFFKFHSFLFFSTTGASSNVRLPQCHFYIWHAEVKWQYPLTFNCLTVCAVGIARHWEMCWN